VRDCGEDFWEKSTAAEHIECSTGRTELASHARYNHDIRNDRLPDCHVARGALGHAFDRDRIGDTRWPRRLRRYLRHEPDYGPLRSMSGARILESTILVLRKPGFVRASHQFVAHLLQHCLPRSRCKFSISSPPSWSGMSNACSQPIVASLDLQDQFARLSHQLAKLPTLGNGFAGIEPMLPCILVAARSPRSCRPAMHTAALFSLNGGRTAGLA